MAIESERLLTVREVADRLHVHPITVRRLIGSGRLPAVRIGRSVRVCESDLEAFLRQQEAPRAKLPYRWPPTEQEMERRKKIAEEMRRLRASSPPLGITTAELVHLARRARDWMYKDEKRTALGR